MLDHIFIQLSSVPPTPPSLPGLPARTYVQELMWQYPIKNIQVDVTFIFLKLIDGVPLHAKGA